MEQFDEILQRITEAQKRPFIITIDGGTSAGKTHLYSCLQEILKKQKTKYITLEVDDYLIPREERKRLKEDYYNLKKWFNLDLLATNLREIADGKRSVIKPKYNHKTGRREQQETIKIPEDGIIFVIGIFSFDERIRKFADLNVLVEAATEERLRREIERNREERLVEERETVRRFTDIIDPTYQEHMKNVKNFADIVINNN